MRHTLHDPNLPARQHELQSLVAMRCALGVSATDLSAAAGLHRSDISRWERGRRPIPERNLRAYRSGLARLARGRLRALADKLLELAEKHEASQ